MTRHQQQPGYQQKKDAITSRENSNTATKAETATAAVTPATAGILETAGMNLL